MKRFAYDVRCHRLAKDCQPSLKVRKRRTTNKAAAEKTAELEQKLDGLVALLTAATKPFSQNGTGSPSSAEDFQQVLRSLNQPALAASNEWREQNGRTVGHKSDASSYTPNIPTPIDSTAPSDSSHQESPAYRLHPVDPGEILRTFRDEYLPYFPFMVIADSTAAHTLAEELPFLWTCIIAICSKSVSQQDAMGMEIRETLGRKTLVEGEKSVVSTAHLCVR